MYQFFEILAGDGAARMYRPAQPISLEVVVAMLGTSRLLVTDTERLGLLVWIGADALASGRKPNPRGSAVARAVFQSSTAAVCGPLVVTGGSVGQPLALDQDAADEAFAYLSALESAGIADEGRR